MTLTYFASCEQGRLGIATIRAMLAQRDEGPHTPVADRRARLEAFAANAEPVHGVAIEESILGGVRTLTITPPDPKGSALFLHGGAYVLGSADTHKWLAARYALACGSTFHVVDYRLAPEHPYPAALDDALAAWSALDHSRPVPLVGDSAGGGLALATAIACRDRALPRPVAVMMLSPWLDLSLSGSSLDENGGKDIMLSRPGLAADAHRYRGGLGPEDPRISPLFADINDLPPLFVQVGSDEVLRSDAERLHAFASEAGQTCDVQLWHDMTHSWPAFGKIVPQAQSSIDQFGRWFRQRTEADNSCVKRATDRESSALPIC